MRYLVLVLLGALLWIVYLLVANRGSSRRNHNGDGSGGSSGDSGSSSSHCDGDSGSCGGDGGGGGD